MKSAPSDAGTSLVSKSSKAPVSPNPPVSAGLTIRAVLVGFLFTVLLTIWALESEFVTRSSPITVTHLPVAALCPFLIMVFLVNPLLKAWPRGRPFSRQELIVVFFLVFTASAIPGWAFSNYTVSVISGPFYYASVENRWAELFLDYLPEWLVLRNIDGSLTDFYEGVPDGSPIRWQYWFVPMVWWTTLYIAIFMVGAALMVILRKQWVEHERLAFPLAQVPLILVEGAEDQQKMPTIARNKVFWWGFGLTLGIMIWNMFHYFNLVPAIPIGVGHGTSLTLYESFPILQIKFNFLLVAVAYFTRIEVLASVWLFHLIRIVEQGVINRVGMPLAAVTLDFQHLSGFIIFTVFTTWMARKHIADVFKKAFGKAPHIDDSREFFSYRTAVFTLIFGLLYMVCWLYTTGMDLWVICFMLGLLMVLYLAVTRVVAETGLVSLDLPHDSANEITHYYVGTDNISPQSMTGMWLSATFTRNWRTLGMCSVAHAAKVGDSMGGVGRGVFGAIGGTLILGFATALIYTLYLGYDMGASQMTGGAFKAGAEGYWTQLGTFLNNPQSLTATQWAFAVAGGVITIFLIWGYHHVPAWPLHPVGFGIATAYAVDMAFFSILVVWLVKSLIMRLGGVALFRAGQPFFIGMLCAHALGVLISFTVDYIWFPGAGHIVDDW